MGIKTEGSRARIVGGALARRVCSSRSLGALGCDAQWRSSRGLPAVATLGARRLTLAARLAPTPGCTGEVVTGNVLIRRAPRRTVPSSRADDADTARLLPIRACYSNPVSAECSVPLGIVWCVCILIRRICDKLHFARDPVLVSLVEKLHDFGMLSNHWIPTQPGKLLWV